jgi:hypothetical protein
VDGSEAWKVKVAEAEGVLLGGPLSIVVCGGVLSIVHVCESGVWSTFPALSRPRTWNVWEPSATELYDFGDVHDVQAPPSRRQSAPPGSVVVK